MHRFLLNKYANLLFTFLVLLSLGISRVSAQTPNQDADQAGLTTNESNPGFALFEAIENNAGNRTATPTRRNSRNSRATVAEPEFTLLGTSRIGDKYSAILQHKSGEAIIVEAGPSASTAIPEHDDYSIVKLAAGSVSIRYPGNTTCVEFLDRGVSCNEADNIAELGLAASEPLAPSESSQIFAAQAIDVQANDSGANPAGGQDQVINPFAALQEAQNGEPVDRSTNAENRQFSPRRIAPEDVPPGMRVVSTPFGDRLVEQ